MGPHFLWAGVVLTLAAGAWAFAALKQRLFQNTVTVDHIEKTYAEFYTSYARVDTELTKLKDRLAKLERIPPAKRPQL